MLEFVPLAALIVTILVASGSVIWKLANNKTEIIEKLGAAQKKSDDELASIRTAAFIEYKELRREITDKIDTAYRELGEAPKALREHVSSFEIFVRDKFLLKTDYERDQDRLLLAFKTLSESVEKRLDAFESKMERTIERALAQVPIHKPQ